MTKKICHSKPVSKQAEWKRQMIAEGRCPQCGLKNDKPKGLCTECTVKKRIYQRRVLGFVPRQDAGVGRPVIGT